MNVMGEKKRSWRKARKRGVSPIIATILLVAITVVLAAVLYVLISGLTKGPGTAPLGSALALGNPTAAKGAGTTWYENFTVESASSGITWNSVNLKVVAAGGTVVGTVTAFGVYSLAGTSVCGASGTTESSWSTGSGATAIASTQFLSITSTGTLSGAGNTLQAIGVGSFQGTVSVAIP